MKVVNETKSQRVKSSIMQRNWLSTEVAPNPSNCYLDCNWMLDCIYLFTYFKKRYNINKHGVSRLAVNQLGGDTLCKNVTKKKRIKFFPRAFVFESSLKIYQLYLNLAIFVDWTGTRIFHAQKISQNCRIKFRESI